MKNIYPKNGSMLIISGPSGSGKSTICKAIAGSIPNIFFSISSTTRIPREGEMDGLHYHFITQEEFLRGIKDDEFLEWAEVHGNYYGTSKKPIENALKRGDIVLFDVDVQGHRNLKKHYGNFAKSLFITTESKEILGERLTNRATDRDETIELRLMHAYNEMQHIDEFDYLIINDDADMAKDMAISIVKSLQPIHNVKNRDLILKNWLINSDKV